MIGVCRCVWPRDADILTHPLQPLGCCKLLPERAAIRKSGHDHCKLLANVPPLGTPIGASLVGDSQVDRLIGSA